MEHGEAEDEEGGGGGPGGMDMNALKSMLGKGGAGPGGLDMDMLQSMMGKFGGGGKGKGKGKGKGAAAAADPRVVRGPEVGDTITVHGLKGAPELNGIEGKVVKWIAASGRWEVQLEAAKGTKALKVDNLRVSVSIGQNEG